MTATTRDETTMDSWTTVTTDDGAFQAYVARPAVSPAACIVVLQEIFGVNVDMRKTCDELAADGHLAIAPDLFWRSRPGLDLSDKTDTEWKTGLDLYNAFDIEKGVSDIQATMRHARTLQGTSGKIGVMGFCMGGLLTFIVASRVRVDAAVVYYGGNTEKHLAEASTLASPLLMHLGEEDEYISKDARARIQEALAGIYDVRIFTYPGAMHAFARHAGIHYRAEAASVANARTKEFLASHLK